MQEIKLLVSPSELANIKGIKINTVFHMIRNNELRHYRTIDGIKIPIIYRFD